MAGSTGGVRQLVADVLKKIPQPYSDDITDVVCLTIESDRRFKTRYDELAADLRYWVVNNWIGRYTAELTGRKSAEQVVSRSKLITSYKKLRS
jgi:hypothetical protein